MEFFKTTEAYEYFCGLVIADGHMSQSTRQRGKIAIELKDIDVGILEQMQEQITVFSSIRERTRKSNFSESFTSKTLGIFNKDFRDFMVGSGVPYGSKVDVKVPEWAKESKNFWRGIIDGDGSLGITKNNLCFISLVTKSEDMSLSFCNLIKSVTGLDKTINRNKRDGVYNIVLFTENAQQMVNFLGYNNSNFSLPRKKELATQVLAWNRPSDLKKITFERKGWTKEDDKFILEHSMEESVMALGRTIQSVKMRKYKLNNH